MIENILIDGGLGNDWSGITLSESSFNDGDSGEIRFYIDYTAAGESLSAIETGCDCAGVVTQIGGVLIIPFIKKTGEEPLSLISSIARDILSTGSVLGWQLFKTENTGIPLWIWAASVIGGVFVVAAMKKDWLHKKIRKIKPF